MKLKVFIFLSLFFSSFQIFAGGGHAEAIEELSTSLKKGCISKKDADILTEMIIGRGNFYFIFEDLGTKDGDKFLLSESSSERCIEFWPNITPYFKKLIRNSGRNGKVKIDAWDFKAMLNGDQDYTPCSFYCYEI